MLAAAIEKQLSRIEGDATPFLRDPSGHWPVADGELRRPVASLIVRTPAFRTRFDARLDERVEAAIRADTSREPTQRAVAWLSSDEQREQAVEYIGTHQHLTSLNASTITHADAQWFRHPDAVTASVPRADHGPDRPDDPARLRHSCGAVVARAAPPRRVTRSRSPRRARSAASRPGSAAPRSGGQPGCGTAPAFVIRMLVAILGLAVIDPVRGAREDAPDAT